MRDEHQGRLPSPLQAEQKLDHLVAGLAVEIAGRLVGEDDLRTRAERARQCHTLLLAARQLRRKVIGAMRDADFRQQAAGDIEGVGLAGELERQGDVLQRRHGRHQVERLEDDADVAAAHERQRVLAEMGEIVSGDADGAGRGALQSGHDHQQRGLAGAAGTDDGDRLAWRDVDVDAAQNLDGTGAAGQRQRDIVEGDHGFSHFGKAPSRFWAM